METVVKEIEEEDVGGNYNRNNQKLGLILSAIVDGKLFEGRIYSNPEF